MESLLSPPAVLTAVGAAHALALVIFLLLSRRRLQTVGWLAALLLVVGVCIAGTLLYTAKFFLLVPHLAETYVPFTFLIGPLVYLHARSLTSSGFSPRWHHLLHAVPFAAYHLLLIPFYLSSATEKIAYIHSTYEVLPLAWRVSTGLFLIHLLSYIAFAVRDVRRADGRRAPHREEASWMIAIVGIVWCMMAVRYIVDFSSETLHIGPVAGTLGVFGIGYLWLWRTSSAHPTVKRSRPDERPTKKYKTSTLSSEDATVLAENLRVFMRTEKPYLDEGLSLADLAQWLDVPAHHVSQVLNEEVGQSFFDFVHTFRVDEAKRMLRDPSSEQLTISAISLECGFQARSTFYAAFKKQVGMTPSAYRRTK